MMIIMMLNLFFVHAGVIINFFAITSIVIIDLVEEVFTTSTSKEIDKQIQITIQLLTIQRAMNSRFDSNHTQLNQLNVEPTR